MPNTSLVLYANGGLHRDSDAIGPYYYNENVRLKVNLQGPKTRFADQGVNFFREYPYSTATSVTVNVSIGSIYGSPTRGEFSLGTGSATASGLAHNATTTQLKNAVSAVYGNVSVTTYGRTVADGWIITAATANTALTINGLSQSLSPYSTVDVIDLTSPSTGVTAQKIVRLRRSPAISVTTFGLPTNLEQPTLTLVSTAGSFVRYRVDVPEDTTRLPLSYSFDLSFTGAATFTVRTDPIRTNLPPAQLFDGDNPRIFPANRGAIHNSLAKSLFGREGDSVLSVTSPSLGLPFSWHTILDREGRAFDGIYLPPGTTTTYYNYRMVDLLNIQVTPATGTGYDIFLGNAVCSSLNVAATLVTRGLITGDGFFDLGVVTFAGAQFDELFEEARRNEVALTLEVSLTDQNQRETLLQAPVSVRRTVA